jgi:hypothetical protein
MDLPHAHDEGEERQPKESDDVFERGELHSPHDDPHPERDRGDPQQVIDIRDQLHAQRDPGDLRRHREDVDCYRPA